LQPEDIELVERLQKGEKQAFDLIYEKYSGKLFSFGMKYLHSTAEAEELVQSVFLKLWENSKNLKKELSFKSFLFTMAYHEICKIFRRRSYGKKFIDDTLYEDSQSSNEIENNIHFKHVLEQVLRIVDKLPKNKRTVFLKSWMEGKSTKEISVEVGLSPGTVDNYVSESLKFIRTQLDNKSMLVILLLSMLLL
jgi:RNA polymerase sigma-70 factor (ECF subfamily)